MTLWSYPSLTKVQELQGAHDERILGSAVSPDGCTVVTGAADENLKVSHGGDGWILSRARAQG